MKQKIFISTIIALCSLLFIGNTVFAEDLPAGTVIPKLAKTANDPMLQNGKVYPFWGPPCQRYTYSAIYSDKEGRAPEYMQIYFNGKMIDMEKEDPKASNYKKGVKYVYKNVPNKFGSNFYYFEASNRLGRTRASIIDSPDNGPVLFDSDFKHNEIVLIDPSTGQEVWRYKTGAEWVGAVALSDDGQYLAAQTSNHVYLFNTNSNKPLWDYKSTIKGNIGGDVKGGVAISKSGDKIFAAINGQALMFGKSSNKPVWTYNLENNGGGAYGVDISRDGQLAAVAMAGSESDENTNVLILLDSKGKKLWQYHSSGNWHEVKFSKNSQFLSSATGCPDRRGYLFSIDSAKPIIKSDPLSKESPIDEASISADGQTVAFGVESGYGAIVLMDKSTKQIIWRYEIAQGRSVRALSMTPSGEFIGAATFGGDILIFDKNSNKPIEQLKVNSTIGAFDISDDGQLFATGSADKKVRIFEKDASSAKAEILLDEYVGELDISANGKFVAAGTSGSVYFFETLLDLNNIQTQTCDKVIEPPKEDTTLFGGQNGGGSAVDDVIKATDNSKSIFSWPQIISTCLATLSLILLLAYLLIRHRKNLPRQKFFIIVNICFILLFGAATIYFWQTKVSVSDKQIIKTTTTTNATEEVPADSTKTTSEQNIIKTENGSSTQSPTTIIKEGSPAVNSTICGNSMCEPSSGETKESCPKDCQNSQ